MLLAPVKFYSLQNTCCQLHLTIYTKQIVVFALIIQTLGANRIYLRKHMVHQPHLFVLNTWCSRICFFLATFICWNTWCQPHSLFSSHIYLLKHMVSAAFAFFQPHLFAEIHGVSRIYLLETHGASSIYLLKRHGASSIYLLKIHGANRLSLLKTLALPDK